MFDREKFALIYVENLSLHSSYMLFIPLEEKGGYEFGDHLRAMVKMDNYQQFYKKITGPGMTDDEFQLTCMLHPTIISKVNHEAVVIAERDGMARWSFEENIWE